MRMHEIVGKSTRYIHRRRLTYNPVCQLWPCEYIKRNFACLCKWCEECI